ncbi:MAG: hypothetical protein ACQEXV_25210 [Bacillota bacterium]
MRAGGWELASDHYRISCGAALVRYASMRTIERLPLADDPGGPLDSGQRR